MVDVSAEVEEKANRLYKLAGDLGYSHESSCGVCGNVMMESGFDESIHEGSGGGGYGLGQWTPASNLYSQGAMLGYSQSECEEFDVQADILLRGDETGQWSTSASTIYDSLVDASLSLSSFKTSTNIDKATVNYMAHWERPSYIASINHKEARKEYANYFGEILDGNGGGGGTGGTVCYINPIEGTSLDESSFGSEQLFGWSESRPGNFHCGLDFGSIDHPGNELLAVCDGEIVKVEALQAGYEVLRSFFILFDGLYNIQYQEFTYNVSNIKVSVGDKVKKGDVLAIRDEDHLHLGFTKELDFATAEASGYVDDGTWENPLNFLGKCVTDPDRPGGGDGGNDDTKRKRNYTLQNIRNVFVYDNPYLFFKDWRCDSC